MAFEPPELGFSFRVVDFEAASVDFVSKQGVMNKKPTACRDTKHQSNRYVAIFGVHLLQNAIEYLHRGARYYNYATLATHRTQNVIN